MQKVIKLISSQNDIYEVQKEIISCSGIISIFFNEQDDGPDDEALPLPNVSSPILEKVLTWASHHYGNPQPANADMTLWDADFLSVDKSTLIDLVAAADYLDIPDLWNLGCEAVANMTEDEKIGSGSRQI